MLEEGSIPLQRLDETELQWLERILPEGVKEYADVFLRVLVLPHPFLVLPHPGVWYGHTPPPFQFGHQSGDRL